MRRMASLCQLKPLGMKLGAYKRTAWHSEWDERARCVRNPASGKVLVRMTPTEDFGKRRQVPLLIFWKALAPDFARGITPRVKGGASIQRGTPRIWSEGARAAYLACGAGKL